MTGTALTLHFAPVLPMPWIYALCAVSLLFLACALFVSRRDVLWRTLCAASFLLIFLNPSIAEEKREAVPDVAVVIADRSPSQQNGERLPRTERALKAIAEKMAQYKERVELRIVDAPAGGGALTRDTKLFEALEQAFSDVPESRRAGAVLITDGQIHDVPGITSGNAGRYGPVHALISGEKDEKDRQLVILESPSYGIVGQSVTIRYRVEDAGTGEETATVLVRQDSQPPRIDLVPVNEEQEIRITVDHAGQNIVDIEASPLDGEITTANNRAPLVINGVRDRLRVLLVSGQPHAGGRTWRDILTSDPGVDLVHFTILREPDKLDATPQNELSLIAFPFRELFEVKLYDFDLIIFDRYKLNRILPNYYFANIAKYVREGGALLEASGPAFSGIDSIYTTALKDILPGYPAGNMIEKPYRPAVTEKGLRHPVTQNLSWRGGEWGRWLRQVAVRPLGGDVLMNGADNEPLLLLNRIGEGRVAQLASDQIWLWARGYDGGGPQAELLRRLAHWLMKEPELEEDALDVATDGSAILIRRRSLTESKMTVLLGTPKGEKRPVELTSSGDGTLSARIEAEELGIYTVNDGEKTRYAIVGDLNPPELRGVKATGDKIAPYAGNSGGGVIWLEDEAEPGVRLQPPGRTFHGRNWLAFRENRSYTVAGVTDKPFLPSWLYALGLLTLAVATWWFEGRSSRKL